MPEKMWKQCKVAGCNKLTKEKYCTTHGHIAEKEKRESSTYYNKYIRNKNAQKFYESSAWRKLRNLKLQLSPLCEICQKNNILTPAKIVDHITEIADGGAPLAKENLQSLCLACHNKKTSAERAKRKDDN